MSYDLNYRGESVGCCGGYNCGDGHNNKLIRYIDDIEKSTRYEVLREVLKEIDKEIANNPTDAEHSKRMICFIKEALNQLKTRIEATEELE